MSEPTTADEPGRADTLAAAERRTQQRAWNWYDWANSAFYTSVLSVLFGPYMIVVAGRAAGCPDPTEACNRTVSVLGLDLAAGSLPSYLTTFATIVGALVLPVVGAWADRSAHKKRQMGAFAWSGAAFAALLFFLEGDNWQLGAVAVVVSSVLAGCAMVSYYAILNDIATEAERDAVSSRGWAFGYLGGGLLLLVNLVLVVMPGAFGVDAEMAVRLSMLSAAIWWAGFTIIPVVKLRDYEPRAVAAVEGGVLRRSFGQLAETFREIRSYPMTLTFLLAFVFYNDGIQTVITVASVYGRVQLGFETEVLIGTILLIQFVAFAGAVVFGRLAAAYGAYRCILVGVFVWMVIVVAALALPAGNLPLFLAVAVAIGIVMGGTQALSRSLYSVLIPRGREGAYFSLYNAAERGTSWLGTLLFGVVFQLTGSYRPSILALIVFFVVGAVLLLRLDVRRGIRDAGNAEPAVV